MVSCIWNANRIHGCAVSSKQDIHFADFYLSMDQGVGTPPSIGFSLVRERKASLAIHSANKRHYSLHSITLHEAPA